MSAWNITCTTRHPQQCTCKILFVWHQSFIVESSGQTSWQTKTHLHTHKQLHTVKLECDTWYHHPPTAWLEQESQCEIIDAITLYKIIVFEIICYVAYYSPATFTFPIEQPSNKAAKCDTMRSWKLKVKPNLGCCSNTAITISYISVFVSSW